MVEGNIYRSESAAKLARKVEDVMSGYKELYLMRTPKRSYFVQIHTHLVFKPLNIGTSDTDEIKPLPRNKHSIITTFFLRGWSRWMKRIGMRGGIIE